MEQKLPLLPFTLKSALQKVQIAEDAWNSSDPDRYQRDIRLIANGEIEMYF